MLTRIKETKKIGIVQDLNEGTSNSAGITPHTICDKVPAVTFAGTLSFLADEFNQILCSAF